MTLLSIYNCGDDNYDYGHYYDHHDHNNDDHHDSCVQGEPARRSPLWMAGEVVQAFLEVVLISKIHLVDMLPTFLQIHHNPSRGSAHHCPSCVAGSSLFLILVKSNVSQKIPSSCGFYCFVIKYKFLALITFSALADAIFLRPLELLHDQLPPG